MYHKLYTLDITSLTVCAYKSIILNVFLEPLKIITTMHGIFSAMPRSQYVKNPYSSLDKETITSSLLIKL